MKKGFIILVCAAYTGWACAATQPGSVYIDKGVCPGECCRYGAWTVEMGVKLYDQPNGKKVITQLRKGDKARALTGEVHVKPLRIVAADDDPEHGIQKGEPLQVLTYMGEGLYKVVLKDGTVLQMELGEDWGTVSKQTWWVQIEDTAGQTGWTNAPERFSLPTTDCE